MIKKIPQREMSSLRRLLSSYVRRMLPSDHPYLLRRLLSSYVRPRG